MGRLSGRPGADPSAEHGTRTKYRGTRIESGCRCADCRDANNVYARQWYARTRVRGYNVRQNEVVPASRKRPGTVASPSREGASNG